MRHPAVSSRGGRRGGDRRGRRIGRPLAGALGALLVLAGVARAGAPATAWEPARLSAEDTVELRTTAPGEEPHWFKVWLVVLDGQLYVRLYVRLGGRAAGRVEGSETKPLIGVRIAGLEFDDVVGTPVPDMAGPVADAMADKYWSDVFVRFVDHPLTLRLAPRGDQSGAPAAAGAAGDPSAQSTR
jgi:hypothetical protein